MKIEITNTKPIVLADALWQTAIDGIVRRCRRMPGLRARLYRRMCRDFPRAAGQPWSRTQVDSWLHTDPLKRHQPGLGAGLALLLAAQREASVLPVTAAEVRAWGSAFERQGKKGIARP